MIIKSCDLLNLLYGNLGDAVLLYHFNGRKVDLTRLCVRWRRAMRDMPDDVRLPQWAPPVEELDAMERDLGSELWRAEDEAIEEQDSDDELTSSEESDMDALDPGLLERLDALEVADWVEPELD